MRKALSFLTPLGGPSAPGSTAWFPAVGAAMGLALGGMWWLASEVWPASVAAALVVAADLALTGLLHADGLVDAADGLLPHLPAERRLSVMAEPGAGAFGVAVLGAALLLRWTALSTLRPAPFLLAGLWCASRTGMAVTAARVPYARAEGLASAFVGGSPALFGLVLAPALALLWRPAGVVAVLAAAAAFAGVVAFARRRIGGFTGDILGAAGLVSETAGLVIAAARW